MRLTSLHAHSSILSSITHLVISVGEDAWLCTIIEHGEMVNHAWIHRSATVCSTIQIILVGHSSSINFIEYPALRLRVADNIEIIEEWRHSIRRQIRRREWLVTVL